MRYEWRRQKSEGRKAASTGGGARLNEEGDPTEYTLESDADTQSARPETGDQIPVGVAS